MNIQIGYIYNDDKIWTIEIKSNMPIENKNQNYLLQGNFKLVKIEDDSGKTYQKIPNYCIGKTYVVPRKSNFRIHFDIINAKMYNFYNEHYDKFIKYTGVIREYHENGILRFEYFLDSGKINGKFISYYENGSIEEESNFVNGLRHDITKYYNRVKYYGGEYANLYDIVCNYEYGKVIKMNIENITNVAIDNIITKESEKYIDGNIYYIDIRITDKPIIIHNDNYNLECTFITYLDHNEIERYKLNTYKITLKQKFIKHNVEQFIKDIPYTLQYNDHNRHIWWF